MEGAESSEGALAQAFGDGAAAGARDADFADRGYPPDKQEAATRAVLEQAEVLSKAWGDG